MILMNQELPGGCDHMRTGQTLTEQPGIDVEGRNAIQHLVVADTQTARFSGEQKANTEESAIRRRFVPALFYRLTLRPEK